MTDRVFDHPTGTDGPTIRLVKRQGGRQSQGLFGDRSLRPLRVKRTEFPLCYGPPPWRLYKQLPATPSETPSGFAFTAPSLRYQPQSVPNGFGPGPARLKPSRRPLPLTICSEIRCHGAFPGIPAFPAEPRSPSEPRLERPAASFRERWSVSPPQVPSKAEIARLASPPRPRAFSMWCQGFRIHHGPTRFEESMARLGPLPPPPTPPSIWIHTMLDRGLSWSRLSMPEKPRLPNAFPLIGLPPAEELTARRSLTGIQHRQRERSHWLFPRASFEDVHFHGKTESPSERLSACQAELPLASRIGICSSPHEPWHSPWTGIVIPSMLAWRHVIQRLPHADSVSGFAGRSLVIAAPRARWKPLTVSPGRVPGGVRHLLAAAPGLHGLNGFIRTSPFVLKRLRTLRLDRSFLRHRAPFSMEACEPGLIIPPMPDAPKLSARWNEVAREDGLTSSPLRAERDLTTPPGSTLPPSGIIPRACRLDSASQRFLPHPAVAQRTPLSLKRSSSRFSSGRGSKVALEPLSVMGRRTLATIVPRLRATPGQDIAPGIPAPALPDLLRMWIPIAPFIFLTWHGRFPPHEGAFPRRIRSQSALAAVEGYRWRPPTLLARRLDSLRQFICSFPADPMAFRSPFRWYNRRIKTDRHPLPLARIETPRLNVLGTPLAAAPRTLPFQPAPRKAVPFNGEFADDRLQPQDRLPRDSRALPMRFPVIARDPIRGMPLAVPVFSRVLRDRLQAVLGPFPFGFPDWVSRPLGFASTASRATFIPFFLYSGVRSGRCEIRLNRHTRHRSPTNLRFPRRFLFPVKPPFALVPHTIAPRTRVSIFDRRGLTPFPAPLPKVFLFSMDRDSWIPRVDGYRSGGSSSRMARIRATLPFPLPSRFATVIPLPRLGLLPPPAPRHQLALPTLVSPLPSSPGSPLSFRQIHTLRDEALRSHGTAALHPPQLELASAPEKGFERLEQADQVSFEQSAIAASAHIVPPPAFPGFKARFRVLRFPWRPETSILVLLPPAPREIPDELTIETPDYGSDLRLSEIRQPSYQIDDPKPLWIGMFRGKRGSIIGRLKAALPNRREGPLTEPVFETPVPRELPPPALMGDIHLTNRELYTSPGAFPALGTTMPGSSLFRIRSIDATVPAFRLPPGFRAPKLFLDAPHFVIAGCSAFRSLPRLQVVGSLTRRPPGTQTEPVGSFPIQHSIKGSPCHHRHFIPAGIGLSRLVLPARQSLETAAPDLAIRHGEKTDLAPGPANHESSWEPRSSTAFQLSPRYWFLDGEVPHPPRPMPANPALDIPLPPLRCGNSPASFQTTLLQPRTIGLRFSPPPHRGSPCLPREAALPEWIDLPLPERPPLSCHDLKIDS